MGHCRGRAGHKTQMGEMTKSARSAASQGAVVSDVPRVRRECQTGRICHPPSHEPPVPREWRTNSVQKTWPPFIGNVNNEFDKPNRQPERARER